MIELHYFPGNASMAPHILLQELGLPFQLRLVDRAHNAHKAPDYLALNPNGLIPVLRDGPLVLFETAAVCLHLADLRPDAGLLPPLGSAERALAYRWLLWMSNTLQVTLGHYFYPERVLAGADAAVAAQIRACAQAQVGAQLAQIEAQLAGHGQPWLLGTHYSLLDGYGLMLCRWTRGFGGPGPAPARTRPAICAWLDRVLARPAVQRVLADEGLAAPWV
jgi:glutathione S-transferase